MRTLPSDLVLRSAYTPPAFLVKTVELGFDLDPANTRVAARLTLQRNPAASVQMLELYGDGQKLCSIRMNGELLAAGDYALDASTLRIAHAPDEVTLEIDTLIHPNQNTTLMGLYVSNGNFFTQCEAEGFRKITYFPDRPDVMAKYTVMLRADKQSYPVLLCNGNLLEQGDLEDGRHYALWQDPFSKPSYLFALVAGDLVCQEENFTLASGRNALLQVWVEPGNLDKTDHAMTSLKHSIRWDEQRYGLELDLERFMIVAVGDFNMGAMENKGLNIFNTKYVLANPRIATDADYANVESVVGHEYFHNWTGNRVTCRDWFQLSLKEGLTVFRDQEFSADMAGMDSGVKRIQEVRALRQVQFSEDAGPMAHPVRPDSYSEINNFYTATIYNKGAEVVRMYQTLLGRDGFRKGMDLYFARHDGQAVSCDDFRRAMSDANNRDLTQFEHWYSQAGTPHLQVQTAYDEAAQRYDITLTQSCPATPGQTEKRPFHLPCAIGLLDAQGNDLPLRLAGAVPGNNTTCVLELTAARQTFSFTGVKAKPTPSLLRNFSAPVTLDYAYTDAELAHLLAHDSDPFNRWQAGQILAMQRLIKLTRQVPTGEPLTLDELFVNALRSTLNDTALNPAFRAQVLTLPSEATLAEQFAEIDPHAIHAPRQFMHRSLANALKADFIAIYESNLTCGKYSPDTPAAAQRALKNLSLAYLLEWRDASTLQLAEVQLAAADNMTDRIAALAALLDADPALAAPHLQDYYRDFADEALVIDKWFSLQAAARTTDVGLIRQLMAHPAFTLHNPNRARSLIFSFCNGNPAQFHTADGYAFWAEQVIALDALNPQVAARLVRTLDHWKKYLPALRTQMQAALQQVEKSGNLSRDVRELVSKALA